MDVAHAVDDRLFRDWLMLQGQGRIFVDQLDQRGIDLFLVGLVLGADRSAVRLRRIVDRRNAQGMVPARQRVSGGGDRKLADAADITRDHFGRRLQRLAFGQADCARSLRLVLAGVEQRGSRRQRSRAYFNVADPADEGICRGLEDEGRQRAIRICRQRFLRLGARVDRFDGRDLPR